MLRQSPIFQALDRNVVSSGLQPDIHPLNRLLWEKAANVTFYSGRVKRRKGQTLLFKPDNQTVRGLSQQFATNGVRWVWTASGPDIYRWYGPAPELITSLSWLENSTSNEAATFVDFTHYGDWTIINNTKNSPSIYKPGTGLAAYAGPSGVAKYMKKLSFILAIGYGARGTTVGWSDGSNIEDWTPTAENSAGSLAIDDFDTKIVTANRLGQSISVFNEDQVALVSYISNPYYFGQKVVLDGIGAVGKYSVCGDGTSNFGVGRNGVWWTDGNSFRYIDEGFLHDYLQDNVNWSQMAKIHAVRNDYTGCIEFFFPMGGSNIISEGWSWDPRTGGWSPLPPVALKDERKLMLKPLVGTEDSSIMLDEHVYNVDTPLTLETRPMLMQLQSQTGLTDIHNSCRVDEVVLLLKEAAHVDFRIGSAQKQENEFNWSQWQELDPASRTYLIDAIPDGVFWKLQFRSTKDIWKLDLQGFMLFGSMEGTGRDR